jgi:hypothetical protein
MTTVGRHRKINSKHRSLRQRLPGRYQFSLQELPQAAIFAFKIPTSNTTLNPAPITPSDMACFTAPTEK